MRIIRRNELRYAVFAMAKERGLLPDKVGQEEFWEHVTKYIKLPEYCRLVVAVLKKKGVDMDLMRSKLMMVCSYSAKPQRRKDGKRK